MDPEANVDDLEAERAAKGKRVIASRRIVFSFRNGAAYAEARAKEEGGPAELLRAYEDSFSLVDNSLREVGPLSQAFRAWMVAKTGVVELARWAMQDGHEAALEELLEEPELQDNPKAWLSMLETPASERVAPLLLGKVSAHLKAFQEDQAGAERVPDGLLPRRGRDLAVCLGLALWLGMEKTVQALLEKQGQPDLPIALRGLYELGYPMTLLRGWQAVENPDLSHRALNARWFTPLNPAHAHPDGIRKAVDEVHYALALPAIEPGVRRTLERLLAAMQDCAAIFGMRDVRVTSGRVPLGQVGRMLEAIDAEAARYEGPAGPLPMQVGDGLDRLLAGAPETALAESADPKTGRLIRCASPLQFQGLAQAERDSALAKPASSYGEEALERGLFFMLAAMGCDPDGASAAEVDRASWDTFARDALPALWGADPEAAAALQDWLRVKVQPPADWEVPPLARTMARAPDEPAPLEAWHQLRSPDPEERCKAVETLLGRKAKTGLPFGRRSGKRTPVRGDANAEPHAMSRTQLDWCSRLGYVGTSHVVVDILTALTTLSCSNRVGIAAKHIAAIPRGEGALAETATQFLSETKLRRDITDTRGAKAQLRQFLLGNPFVSLYVLAYMDRSADSPLDRALKARDSRILERVNAAFSRGSSDLNGLAEEAARFLLDMLDEPTGAYNNTVEYALLPKRASGTLAGAVGRVSIG